VHFIFAYIIAQSINLGNTSFNVNISHMYFGILLLNDNDKFENIYLGVNFSSIVAILLQLLLLVIIMPFREGFHWIYLSMVILYILVVSIDYWHTENIK